MPSAATHIMFQGEAGSAIEFYSDVFCGFRILKLEKYGQSDSGLAGLIKYAKAELHGHSLIIIDSAAAHDFDFTPSVSLFVEFSTEHELREAFGALAEKGEILMPLDDYGFSEKFGWVKDCFGVSWQLNFGDLE